MKINGQALTSYTEGCPVWRQDVDLTESENDFYVMAYDASDALIGLDFLKVYLVDPSVIRFRINNPAEDFLIVQEQTLTIEGETPSTTETIYRNKTEISFRSRRRESPYADESLASNPLNLTWTDSVELSLGENSLEYLAVDELGQEIGRGGLLVICNGIMRIVEPAADTGVCATSEETTRILLQIDQPARGSTLLINNTVLPSYTGQSTVNYRDILEEGDNRFVFTLFDDAGTQTGYSAITIRKSGTHKDNVGAGFCFIQSIAFSRN